MDTRTEVLRHLKKDKENWVSGEALSRRLGLTRTAVWKTICKLKDDGYQIESTPRKGYRFLKTSEMLLPEEIAEGLDTEVLGKKDIIHLKETDSTNAHAKDLAWATKKKLAIASRDALEAGIHTMDIAIDKNKTVGTAEMGDALVAKILAS